MTVLERFIKYAKIPTFSDYGSQTHPSNESEKVLAALLAQELKDLGVDVYYDQEHCYVYGVLKGNIDAPKIGFISHMDTSPDAKGEVINLQFVENYDGKDIKLSDAVTCEAKLYPDLQNHIGKTLITSDGSTLIGADDKAGIAEIMTMIEYFATNKEQHGDICVCFTPDEEIGEGTMFFDFDKFPADFAYTVDGVDLGEISYDNFYITNIYITINGTSVHPGYAYGIMKNAVTIGMELNEMLPKENAENTKDKEGFYHLHEYNSTVDKAWMFYICRDFTKEGIEKRKDTLKSAVDCLNKKYGNIIEIEINDRCPNMYEVVSKHQHLIDNAIIATKNAGVVPIITPIRGGTDGARLAQKGLPCPNLGAGGHNFHSIYEYVAVEDMKKIVDILIGIVKVYTKDENIGLRRIK